MATATVSRERSLVRRIARLDGEPARLEAVALGLVDALLDRDDETLAAALHALRDARARADGDRELVGRLDAAIAFALWGVERVPSQTAVAEGTQAHDFLSVSTGSPQLEAQSCAASSRSTRPRSAVPARRCWRTVSSLAARSAARCSGT